jgi:hypothetical protein
MKIGGRTTSSRCQGKFCPIHKSSSAALGITVLMQIHLLMPCVMKRIGANVLSDYFEIG